MRLWAWGGMAVALYLGRPGPAAGGGLPGSGFVGKTRMRGRTALKRG